MSNVIQVINGIKVELRFKARYSDSKFFGLSIALSHEKMVRLTKTKRMIG